VSRRSIPIKTLWNRFCDILGQARLSGYRALPWRLKRATNPDSERKYEVQVLLLLATDTIPLDGQIIQRAKELEAVGYGAFDAPFEQC
jgi:hypothetical protein